VTPPFIGLFNELVPYVLKKVFVNEHRSDVTLDGDGQVALDQL
jgi:hypothetical protein